MPRTGKPAIRHVAAVQRAVAVLDSLADGAPELGTNEIARRTGINASTVSRLLATLAEAGLVEHDADSGRYRLGLRLLHLGNAVLARLDLREIARPHLTELAAVDGRVRHALGAGRARSRDRRLRPERRLNPERRASRAAQRRARDRGRQGLSRLRRAASGRRARALHRAYDHRPRACWPSTQVARSHGAGHRWPASARTT